MRVIKLKLKRPSQEMILDRSPPRSRGRKTYTFAGKTMTLPQWARVVGISNDTLWERMRTFGWPIERALTEPTMGRTERALWQRNAKHLTRIAESFRQETAR